MARYLYAATPADYVVNGSTGLPVPGAVVTVWTARTGGSQVTDLQNLVGGAITQVTADSSGFIAFYGPDAMTANLWIYAGSGSRLLVRSVVDPTPSGTALPLSGGTMTGNLTLAGAPSANLHAATKKYVDDNVTNFVAKTGDVMSGTLRVNQASMKVSGDASTYVFERRQGDSSGYGFRLGATSSNPFTATLYDSGGNTLSAALNYSTSSTRWNIAGNTYITGTLQTTGTLTPASIAATSMTGALAMGSNKVTGLGAATTSGDALRYEAWQSWTCAVTASTTNPTGVTQGSSYYTKIGKTVHFRAVVTIPNSTKGSGTYYFSLPVTSLEATGPIGQFYRSSGNYNVGPVVLNWTNTCYALYDSAVPGDSTTQMSQFGSAQISSDTTVIITGTYEAA